MKHFELGRGVGRSVAALFGAAVLILGAGSVVWAQQALDNARQEESETVREGAQTQDQIDDIDDERGNLFRDYKQVVRQLEKFRSYNEELRKLIASQEKEMASLREQIERVGEIDKDVVPLIRKMLEGIEQFVEEDVPFLMEERNKNLAELNKLMPDPNATVAEKFRRVLELYQVENEFGRTIEAYKETVEGEEGEEVELQYLRIGRVALFRQTPEFKETQMWDQANRQWVDLPGRFSDAVRTGRDMAQDFVPPDLLVLPVIVPAQSAE